MVKAAMAGVSLKLFLRDMQQAFRFHWLALPPFFENAASPRPSGSDCKDMAALDDTRGPKRKALSQEHLSICAQVKAALVA